MCICIANIYKHKHMTDFPQNIETNMILMAQWWPYNDIEKLLGKAIKNILTTFIVGHLFAFNVHYWVLVFFF